MKKLMCTFFLLIGISPLFAQHPSLIYVGEQDRHVQGIVYDTEKELLYLSFTTCFVVSDADGKIIASVDEINGHLGAMTFDPKTRKVYASLEEKADEIGASISHGLGQKTHKESAFYVVEIDVDKLTTRNTKAENVMRKISIDKANEFYRDSVSVNGKTLKHRYGCSGIDGVCIAPALGKSTQSKNHLYVACGIYSDTTRNDNDYQILLCYDLEALQKGKNTPAEVIFVKTGNTSYGVQNMAYDALNDQILLAVYRGKKPQYPNYDLFAIERSKKVFKAKLDNVPYENKKVKQAQVSQAWYFKYGSTGFYSLGDGTWYFAEGGRVVDSQSGKKRYYSKTTLYRRCKQGDVPFQKVSEPSFRTSMSPSPQVR